MKKLIQIIFLVVLVFSFVFFPVLQTRAGLFPGVPDPVFLLDPPTSALLSSISGSTAATAASAAAANVQLGILNASIGLPATAGAGLAAADKLAACNGIQKAIDIAGTADTFSSFSIIGGSPAESAQITAKLAALLTVKTCDDVKLLFYKTVPVVNLMMGQELTRKEAVLNAEINSLNTRIENLKQRQSASFKEVLKALAVKLVLTYAKGMTTKMVNSVIAKYKISNFQQYADAVATQVYTTDYVTKNYPKSSNQLILRSILQNQGVQGGVLPLVRQEAKANLGFEPSQLSFTDPDYYTKLAMAGKPETFGPSLQIIKQDQADNAKAQGNLSAAQEIGQGKGFIPVRNCNGSVAQQKNIDQQNIQLSYQVSTAQEIVDRLQASYDSDLTSVKIEDLQKAYDNLKQAESNLQKLPQQTANPIVKMCEGIANPGAFVGDAVANIVKSNLDLGSNIKDQNLPFYGTFIEQLGTGLISNIIEGGKGSNINLLTEKGFAASNILANDLVTGLDGNKALKQANADVQKDTNGGAFLAFDDIDETQQQVPGTYVLKWDASGYPNAEAISIKGGVGIVGGQGVNIQPNTKTAVLSGKTNVVISSPGSYDYLLSIFVKGKQNADKIISVNIQIKEAGNSFVGGGSGPIVFGAYAAKPTVNIRGSVGIHPRGE